MSTDGMAVRDLLGEHDPVTAEYGTDPLARSATRQRIETLTRQPTIPAPAPIRRRAPGPRWATAWVVAASTAALVVVQFGLPELGSGLTGSDRAYAATPHLLSYQALTGDASSRLQQLATSVRAFPASSAPPSAYEYVKTQGWYLNTTVAGGQPTTSAVVPVVVQRWRAPDGSGRERITAGTVEPTDSAIDPATVVPTSDRTLAAGELAAMYQLPLPADEKTLQAVLAAGHPAENGPAETLIAVADLYKDLPVEDPAVRATLLDLVAQLPSLQLVGATTDRLGRPGVAVAIDSTLGGLPNRRTLIFDATSGQLLADEGTLTQSAGKLNVRVPCVIDYTLFEAAASLANLNNR